MNKKTKSKQYIIYILRQFSLKKRLLFCLMILCILSSSVIGTLTYSVSSRTLTNKVSDTANQILATLNPSIYYHMQSYENLLDQFTFSNIIQDNLKHFNTLSSKDKTLFFNQMDDLLATSYSRLPATKDIQVYTSDNTCIYGIGYIPIPTHYLESIHTQLLGKKTSIFFSYPTTANNIILMVRNILLPSSSESVGYVLIAIEEQTLLNLYNNLFNPSEIIIANSQNQVISSNCSDASFGNFISIPTLETSYLITSSISSYGEWQLISLTPYSYIYSELSTLRLSILLIILLFLLITFLLSSFISESICLPLDSLISHLHLVKHSSTIDIIPTDPYHDEISYLITTFNAYTLRIKELIEETTLYQKQTETLRFKMLQAQITPHFLFNTLNSLRFMAMMSNVPHLSNGLNALGSLISHTILQENELITFQEELENIKDYCTLQRIRYGDSFEMIINVDESLLSLNILKLLLQPIVENSILHGMDESKPKIIITLSAHIKNQTLIITIFDTGKGFDPSLPHKPKQKGLSSIGTSNVHDRLVLYFGDEYGVTLYSKPNKGTSVTLTMPIIPQGDENTYV